MAPSPLASPYPCAPSANTTVRPSPAASSPKPALSADPSRRFCSGDGSASATTRPRPTAAAVARTRDSSPRTGVVPPGSDQEPSPAVRTERNPATSRAPPTGTAFRTPAADHAGGSARTAASRPVAPAPPATRCPPRATNRRAARSSSWSKPTGSSTTSVSAVTSAVWVTRPLRASASWPFRRSSSAYAASPLRPVESDDERGAVSSAPRVEESSSDSATLTAITSATSTITTRTAGCSRRHERVGVLTGVQPARGRAATRRAPIADRWRTRGARRTRRRRT